MNSAIKSAIHRKKKWPCYNGCWPSVLSGIVVNALMQIAFRKVIRSIHPPTKLLFRCLTITGNFCVALVTLLFICIAPLLRSAFSKEIRLCLLLIFTQDIDRCKCGQTSRLAVRTAIQACLDVEPSPCCCHLSRAGYCPCWICVPFLLSPYFHDLSFHRGNGMHYHLIIILSSSLGYGNISVDWKTQLHNVVALHWVKKEFVMNFT